MNRNLKMMFLQAGMGVVRAMMLLSLQIEPGHIDDYSSNLFGLHLLWGTVLQCAHLAVLQQGTLSAVMQMHLQ